jgi:hypothetical protein
MSILGYRRFWRKNATGLAGSITATSETTQSSKSKRRKISRWAQAKARGNIKMEMLERITIISESDCNKYYHRYR